jgi:hypothetical protein
MNALIDLWRRIFPPTPDPTWSEVAPYWRALLVLRNNWPVEAEDFEHDFGTDFARAGQKLGFFHFSAPMDGFFWGIGERGSRALKLFD